MKKISREGVKLFIFWIIASVLPFVFLGKDGFYIWILYNRPGCWIVEKYITEAFFWEVFLATVINAVALFFLVIIIFKIYKKIKKSLGTDGKKAKS